MADWPPLRDYSHSRAVVMGTWTYEFLDGVPAAANSVRRMAGLLTGPLCGWPQDRLLLVEDQPSPGDLADQLITAFNEVRDVALFYFVGHGQISPDDQLCLGLVQSRPEANRRAATSLRYSDVRQALQGSDAAVKIVILDCCFAGLATTGSLAGDVLDLTAGTGAYTMAATSAYATAWYEHDWRLAEPQTYFTKYLADLVEEGIPGQPSRLRMNPLFRQLRDNLAADDRPVPQSRAVNDAREFAFAYNAAPPEVQRNPEQELAQLGQQFKKLKTATDAQINALKAEADKRERELARLRKLPASPSSRGAGQQRDLQDAIDEAARQLDNTKAAQAALTTDPASQGPLADGRDSPADGPAQRQAWLPPQPPALPAGRPDLPSTPTAPKRGRSRPTPAKVPIAGKTTQPAGTGSQSGQEEARRVKHANEHKDDHESKATIPRQQRRWIFVQGAQWLVRVIRILMVQVVRVRDLAHVGLSILATIIGLAGLGAGGIAAWLFFSNLEAALHRTTSGFHAIAYQLVAIAILPLGIGALAASAYLYGAAADRSPRTRDRR